MNRHPLARPLAAAFSVLALAALCACGGGDGNYTQGGGSTVGATLYCAGQPACVESNTLATANLHARMYVVSDGQHAQAQAGFLDHDGDNFNVELNGDAAYVVDGATRTPLGVPNRTANTLVTDPYIADLSSVPVLARSYQLQLVRPSGTYTSTVTMPPAFTITAPGVAKLGDDSLVFTLDVDASPDPAVSVQSFHCLDTAGNPRDGKSNQLADTVQRTGPTTYAFSIARFRQDIDPGPGQPTIASCPSVQINVRTNVQGSVDAALAGDSTFIAYQSRSTSFALN